MSGSEKKLGGGVKGGNQATSLILNQNVSKNELADAVYAFKFGSNVLDQLRTSPKGIKLKFSSASSASFEFPDSNSNPSIQLKLTLDPTTTIKPELMKRTKNKVCLNGLIDGRFSVIKTLSEDVQNKYKLRTEEVDRERHSRDLVRLDSSSIPANQKNSGFKRESGSSLVSSRKPKIPKPSDPQRSTPGAASDTAANVRARIAKQALSAKPTSRTASLSPAQAPRSTTTKTPSPVYTPPVPSVQPKPESKPTGVNAEKRGSDVNLDSVPNSVGITRMNRDLYEGMSENDVIKHILNRLNPLQCVKISSKDEMLQNIRKFKALWKVYINLVGCEQFTIEISLK